MNKLNGKNIKKAIYLHFGQVSHTNPAPLKRHKVPNSAASASQSHLMKPHFR